MDFSSRLVESSFGAELQALGAFFAGGRTLVEAIVGACHSSLIAGFSAVLRD
jgi:hypothetical protein